MRLAAGTRLGRFEILSLLGAGGMGEVYRARDGRLGRDVAIKVLAPAVAAHPDRLRRFEQEARAAGRLNHTAITAVFDVGVQDGAPFLVQELLQGQTLRVVLARGRLSLGKVVDYATQIARGLVAAHEEGIVHRDLKPGNLFVTADGRVKILDFGLAKLHPTLAPADAASGTTVPEITEVGAVLGTVGYMSPEQVSGGPVDHRSDVFSFGVVLYEMLSGRRPFHRNTATETLAAIVDGEPGPLPSEVAPLALARIVRRCLEKHPRDRFQSTSDLAFALDALSGAEGTGPATPPPATWRGRAATAVVVVAVLGSIWVGWRLLSTSSVRSARRVRVEKLTSRGNVRECAVSPDGRYLAYQSMETDRVTIWLRDLVDKTETKLVPALEGAFILQFARDGQSLFFVTQHATGEAQALYRVPIIGGEPRLIRQDGVDYRLSPDGERAVYLRSDGALVTGTLDRGPATLLEAAHGPAWAPDGSQLLFIVSRDGRHSLTVAGADGTPQRVVTELTEAPDAIAWRPDSAGACILIKGQPFIVDLQSGSTKPLGQSGIGAEWQVRSFAWVPDGSGLVIWKLPHAGATPDTRPWFLSYPAGELTPIAVDSHDYWGLSLTADGSRLVTIQSTVRSDVVISTGAPDGGHQQILAGTDVRFGARWASDGRVVYSSNEAGSYDLYTCARDGSDKKPLTFNRESNEVQPAPSVDGRYVVFVREQSRRQELYRIDHDGTNLTRLTTAPDDKPWVRDLNPYVSPDGRWVFYSHWDNGPSLWRVPISGGEPALILGARPATPTEIAYGAAASPDGRELAFLYFTTAHDTGTSATDVVVSDIEGRMRRRFDFLQTTTGINENWRVQWSHDGTALYYIVPRGDANALWRQPLSGGARVQVTHFDIPMQTFDWSPDGRSLLSSRTSTSADVVMFTGFH